MTWAEENPEVLLKYGRTITSKSTELNYWNKFMNNDEGSVIMTDLSQEGPKDEGGTHRVYFRDEIEGDGITGNEDFEDRLGSQKTLFMDADYGVLGIALKSKAKKLESKMATETFRTKAHKDLPAWVARRSDKIITAKLTQNATHIVACSAATGIHPVNTTVNIEVGDVLSTTAISAAKRQAKTGIDSAGDIHPIIEPFMVKKVDKEGIVSYEEYFALIVGQYGAEQLKHDALWIEAQKFAAERGDNNAIFTGSLGNYDGVVLFERSNWTAKRAGIITSDVADFGDYAGNFSVYNGALDLVTEINLFLGASAGLMPFDEGFDYYEEPIEGGRKLKIGVDRGIGFDKTKFIGKTTIEQQSEFHNKDFGMLVIVNAKK
ncbi:MAG: hypothetical protein ACI81I_000462 [Arcobacteraceae bacterium]|jgi:hypothetical protein